VGEVLPVGVRQDSEEDSHVQLLQGGRLRLLSRERTTDGRSLGKDSRESSFSQRERPWAARTLLFSSWYSRPGKLPMLLTNAARLSTTATGSL
jgi:hypothetical protein